MYPFIRATYQFVKYRKKPALRIGDIHSSTHYCLPIDLDPWVELNNGRTLTFYDLGRVPMVWRMGLLDVLKRRNWSFTVAGSSVRYRRRVTVFSKLEMKSRIIGRDARFMYVQQSMWQKGEATSSILLRLAVTNGNGIVPTDEVVAELGEPEWNPALPEWVQAWSDAEGHRVWPPEV